MADDRNLLSRSVAALRWIALEHTAALIAVVFAVAGLLLMWVGYLVTPKDGFSALFDALTKAGVDPQAAADRLNELKGSAWTTLFWSVGGTFISIGLVSITWEVIVKKSWTTLFRQEVLDALTDVDIFDRVKARDHEGLLRRLLESFHGRDVGDAMFRESQAITRSSPSMRTNFEYNIKLREHPTDNRFHSAEFHVEFIVRMRARSTISFARLSDSLEFHQKYEELVRAEPDTIYRYIMLSGHVVDPRTSFVITNCEVQNIETQVTFKLIPQVVSTPTNQYTLELRPAAPDQKHLRGLVGRECRVSFTIATLVDKKRNEFPIVLGYPVKSFRSRFDAQAVASEVDVLEFFTSPNHYRREGNGTTLGTGEILSSAFAAGVLDDVILPDSGLTYIWR